MITLQNLTLAWLKENATMIHYFGLGFIQIKLNHHERIHFYTNKLPPIVGEEEAHDHRYDFTSTILYGYLNQELFEICDGDDYILEEETCNPSLPTPKESMPKRCSLIKKGEQHFEAGSTYSINYDVFHRVASSRGITYLVRSDYKQPLAHVLRKRGDPSVCAFSVTIEEAKLWEIVEGMLSQARQK